MVLIFGPRFWLFFFGCAECDSSIDRAEFVTQLFELFGLCCQFATAVVSLPLKVLLES